MNPMQKQQQDEDFASAYNEDMARGSSDDMNPDEFSVPESPGSEGDTASSAADLAIVIGAAPENVEMDAGDPIDPAAEGDSDAKMAEAEAQADEATVEAQSEAPALDVAKETQRLKSWEGRLKARERELEAKAQSGQGMESEDEGESESMDEESSNDKEMATEGADGSLEAAVAQLAADFGDEFVSQIKMIAMASAKEVAAQVAGEHSGSAQAAIDEIIDDLTNMKTRSHFREIKRAHPDFNEVSQSPAFSEWLRSLPEGEREQAVAIAEQGDTEDVIGLLDAFKSAGASPASAPAEEMPAMDQGAVDAAEGVASGGGLRLPAQPGSSQDFAAAWDEFR